LERVKLIFKSVGLAQVDYEGDSSLLTPLGRNAKMAISDGFVVASVFKIDFCEPACAEICQALVQHLKLVIYSSGVK